MKRAVIVIPTYNESKNIERLVGQISETTSKIRGWEIHILVVDSQSPDKTTMIVKQLQKKYNKLHLLETAKEGLGRAYVNGFKYALERLNPYVLFQMDGDLSHNPQKIPDFLDKIEEGADFVIGSRYRPGGSIPRNWAPHRKVFSVLGNLIVRMGFMKIRVTDWTSGYRAIKAWVIQRVIPHVDEYSGYVFQVAMVDTAMKHGVFISEVPINFVDRKHGVSKINSFQYIVQTLWYVFLNSSFIKFGIVGVTGAIIDFGLSYLIIEKFGIHPNLYWVATAISAEVAIISNFLLNNFWSFRHKKLAKSKRNYASKFAKFNLIASGSLIIQSVGIQLATHTFGPELWYVYKILIIALVVIPYSYILYNRVIWKDKR